MTFYLVQLSVIREKRPWGRVLDAGTGLNSVQWLKAIGCQSWLGITADKRMKENVIKEAKLNSVDAESLVVGNWMDEAFVRP